MRRFIFSGHGDDLNEYLYVYDSLLGTKKLVLTFSGFEYWTKEDEKGVINQAVEKFMLDYPNETYWLT